MKLPMTISPGVAPGSSVSFITAGVGLDLDAIGSEFAVAFDDVFDDACACPMGLAPAVSSRPISSGVARLFAGAVGPSVSVETSLTRAYDHFAAKARSWEQDPRVSRLEVARVWKRVAEFASRTESSAADGDYERAYANYDLAIAAGSGVEKPEIMYERAWAEIERATLLQPQFGKSMYSLMVDLYSKIVEDLSSFEVDKVAAVNLLASIRATLPKESTRPIDQLLLEDVDPADLAKLRKNVSELTKRFDVSHVEDSVAMAEAHSSAGRHIDAFEIYKNLITYAKVIRNDVALENRMADLALGSLHSGIEAKMFEGIYEMDRGFFPLQSPGRKLVEEAQELLEREQRFITDQFDGKKRTEADQEALAKLLIDSVLTSTRIFTLFKEYGAAARFLESIIDHNVGRDLIHGEEAALLRQQVEELYSKAHEEHVKEILEIMERRARSLMISNKYQESAELRLKMAAFYLEGEMYDEATTPLMQANDMFREAGDYVSAAEITRLLAELKGESSLFDGLGADVLQDIVAEFGGLLEEKITAKVEQLYGSRLNLQESLNQVTPIAMSLLIEALQVAAITTAIYKDPTPGSKATVIAKIVDQAFDIADHKGEPTLVQRLLQNGGIPAKV